MYRQNARNIIFKLPTKVALRVFTLYGFVNPCVGNLDIHYYVSFNNFLFS